jgi:transcriptional regulator with XRE-family HTH domain
MILLFCFLIKLVLHLQKSIINDTKSKMTNEEIIKIIKERKDVLGINQEYLAELSELGIATLKRFESGKGNITVNNLQKIADILGLEIKLELKKKRINEKG